MVINGSCTSLFLLTKTSVKDPLQWKCISVLLIYKVLIIAYVNKGISKYAPYIFTIFQYFFFSLLGSAHQKNLPDNFPLVTSLLILSFQWSLLCMSTIHIHHFSFARNGVTCWHKPAKLKGFAGNCIMLL